MRGARSGGITADCRFEAKNLSTSPSPTTRPQYQILRKTLRATEALIDSGQYANFDCNGMPMGSRAFLRSLG